VDSPPGGDFQIYATQAHVALTDRLSIGLEKSGYLDYHPKTGDHTTGWLNIAGSVKYVLIRDTEDQFLLSGGIQYETTSGSARVFQGGSTGVFTGFVTTGKQFGDTCHVLDTFGYQFGDHNDSRNGMLFNSFHIDKQVLGVFYPLLECNWYHYTADGNRDLPPSFGGGDGLLNLGTPGIDGSDLVTAAVGLKVLMTDHASMGCAWEVPLSNRQDLVNNRLTVEMQLRY
jgi:hypothetical protein